MGGNWGANQKKFLFQDKVRKGKSNVTRNFSTSRKEFD